MKAPKDDFDEDGNSGGGGRRRTVRRRVSAKHRCLEVLKVVELENIQYLVYSVATLLYLG